MANENADTKKIDVKKLIELNENGKSYAFLAKEYNLTRGKIAGMIHRYREVDEEEKSAFEQSDNFINVICASKRILSVDEIVKQFGVDLSEWEIERYRVKTSEGYRKDRSVSWHVSDGRVMKGDVEDSGKMLVVPLYHVEVRLIRKKGMREAKTTLSEMINDAKRFSPIYEKIIYPPSENGMLYEIDMQDIHFGRLTWAEESGDDYDLDLARKAVESTLLKLLALVNGQSISKILIPLGNDFFNVDNKFNTTTAGTPQQEAGRWQKTFNAGRKLCIWMIDQCSTIAPVDVLIVPGNHDEQRSFYLGEALECWYHNNPNVGIDNAAAKRKYYQFDKCLIGFTHGSNEKLDKLPLLMALEKPDLWGATEFREWHTGDKHNQKMFYPKSDEGAGVVVRIVRSLAAHDAWTFDHGYHALRASEAFLWSRDSGLIAQYTATPDVLKIDSNKTE